MTFAVRPLGLRKGSMALSLIISANTTGYNIRTAAISSGWDEITPLELTLTINSGVYVGGASTSTYALDTGSSYPAESVIHLINNGYIIGCGGNGGVGYGAYTNGSYYYGSAGGAGGPALLAGTMISITNNGIIGGGGGGGGGGQGGYYYEKSIYTAAGGGGGGGRSGTTVSSGNIGGWRGGGGVYAGYGGNGGSSSPGGGGAPAADMAVNLQGGYGGSGGDWGSAGGSGGVCSGAYYANPTRVGPSGGGAGGAAVVGNSYITWLATGTRYGSIT